MIRCIATRVPFSLCEPPTNFDFRDHPVTIFTAAELTLANLQAFAASPFEALGGEIKALGGTHEMRRKYLALVENHKQTFLPIYLPVVTGVPFYAYRECPPDLLLGAI